MELGLIKNYKKWLFLLPLVLFIIDFILIKTGWIISIDQFVYHFLCNLKNPVITKIFILITNLGDLIGISAVIVLIFIFNRKFALNCMLLSALQFLINAVLKYIFKRPRPSVEHLVNVSNYSFPSGHAMAISCLYALIIYYLYHSKCRYRYLLIFICIGIIVLVDLSRVYLGVHYFSDVFAGTMISISLVMYVTSRATFV